MEQEIAQRLQEPLTLTHGDRRFVLDPALVDVRANVDDVVDTAVAESREGNFLERAVGELTGTARRSRLGRVLDGGGDEGRRGNPARARPACARCQGLGELQRRSPEPVDRGRHR